MRQPPLYARAVGVPLIGIPLLLASLGVIASWVNWCVNQGTGGHFSWLSALFAAGIGWRTYQALRWVRAYKTWSAEWNAMGRKGEGGQPAKNKVRSKRVPWFSLLAVLAAIAVPVYLASLKGTAEQSTQAPVLTVIWATAGFFLFVRMLRGWMRGRSGRRAAAGVPVKCLISAGLNPSRASAVRALPEFSARLLAASSANAALEGRGRVQAHAR